MYEIKVTGGTDKYTNAEFCINGEKVGDIQVKDEDFVRFCFDLLGTFKITK